jgi:anti-sigma-K factor RskA
MFDHEYFEYLAGYALGVLTPAEQKKMEEHLRDGCDLCEPELRILNATVDRLPQGLSPASMPEGLKERVRTRMEKEGLFEASPKPVTAGREHRFYWLATAAILAAALAAGLYWNSRLQLNEQAKYLAEKEAQIAAMEKTLQQKDSEISWLRDPGVQLALLTGLAQASHAKGKMIWHPVEHKGIFYVESLPKLDRTKSYQLWVIGAHGPVSAGVFETDKRGAAVLTIERIQGSVDGPPQFAVTIEPYGGVAKPTTNPILIGKPI